MSRPTVSMTDMNTAKIIVRLDAEYRTAEIEVLTPKDQPAIPGFDKALRGIGLRPMRTVELSIPNYRVTRTKVVRIDGSELNLSRIESALHAVRGQGRTPLPNPLGRAA